MMSIPTIFVVDDDQRIRKSLRFLLQTAGYRVESFPDAHTFLEHWNPESHGCVLLDVRMPHEDGVELYRRMKDRGWRPAVVFLTAHGDVSLAVEAMKQGAVDFLLKPVDRSTLLESIRQALDEDNRVRNEIRQRRQWESRIRSLTARELQVMRLVIAGKTTKQIARELRISPRTVEVHRQSIMAKLNITSVTELVAIALECDVCRSDEIVSSTRNPEPPPSEDSPAGS